MTSRSNRATARTAQPGSLRSLQDGYSWAYASRGFRNRAGARTRVRANRETAQHPYKGARFAAQFGSRGSPCVEGVAERKTASWPILRGSPRRKGGPGGRR